MSNFASEQPLNYFTIPLKWDCPLIPPSLHHLSHLVPTLPLMTPTTPLTLAQRIALGLASVMALGLLCSAWLVIPDPAGFGTHQQFGLPPCSFRVVFGIPCPSCGGTTSFAHFVRGQWLRAVQVNAAAFCGAWICLLLVPWGLWCSFRGRIIGLPSPWKTCLSILLVITFIALVQWAGRCGIAG